MIHWKVCKSILTYAAGPGSYIEGGLPLTTLAKGVRGMQGPDAQDLGSRSRPAADHPPNSGILPLPPPFQGEEPWASEGRLKLKSSKNGLQTSQTAFPGGENLGPVRED